MGDLSEVKHNVVRNLLEYARLKRLEDGFDLSPVGCPRLDHPPLKARPVYACSDFGLNDRSLKHYFVNPQTRTALTRLNTNNVRDNPSLNNEAISRQIKRQFLSASTASHNLTDFIPVTQPNGSLLLQRRPKDRPTTLRPKSRYPPTVNGSLPLIRSVPDPKISRDELQRLVANTANMLSLAQACDMRTVFRSAFETKKRKKRRSRSQSAKRAGTRSRDQSAGMSRRPKTGKKTGSVTASRSRSSTSLSTTPASSRSSSASRSIPRRSATIEKREASKSPASAKKSPTPTSTRSDASKRYSGDRKSSQSAMSNLSNQSSARSQKTSGRVQGTGNDLVETYPLAGEGKRVVYEVVVRTAKSKVGIAEDLTDVSIVLAGSNGRSPALQLSKARAFRPGAVDTFRLMTYHVGSISKIALGHSSAASAGDWRPEQVEVTDTKKKQRYTFLFGGEVMQPLADQSAFALYNWSNVEEVAVESEYEDDSEIKIQAKRGASSSSSYASSNASTVKKVDPYQKTANVIATSVMQDALNSDAATTPTAEPEPEPAPDVTRKAAQRDISSASSAQSEASTLKQVDPYQKTANVIAASVMQQALNSDDSDARDLSDDEEPQNTQSAFKKQSPEEAATDADDDRDFEAIFTRSDKNETASDKPEPEPSYGLQARAKSRSTSSSPNAETDAAEKGDQNDEDVAEAEFPEASGRSSIDSYYKVDKAQVSATTSQAPKASTEEIVQPRQDELTTSEVSLTPVSSRPSSKQEERVQSRNSNSVSGITSNQNQQEASQESVNAGSPDRESPLAVPNKDQDDRAPEDALQKPVTFGEESPVNDEENTDKKTGQEDELSTELDALDADGYSALHNAVMKDDLTRVKELLDAGCDPYNRDAKGKTAIELATIHHASRQVFDALNGVDLESDVSDTVVSGNESESEPASNEDDQKNQKDAANVGEQPDDLAW